MMPLYPDIGNSESCPTMTDNEDYYTNDVTLSEADRKSYKRIFSSVLVPYASLTMKEVIGQGKYLLRVDYSSWP